MTHRSGIITGRHIDRWELDVRTREVPEDIFEQLIGALICESAIALLTQRATGAPLHAGDAFGRVLSWLWQTNPDCVPGPDPGGGPDDVVTYVSDLVAQVRYHAPGADESFPLDDLLAGVRRAAAPMPPADGAAMLACLRASLPGYL
jgi:hypothetical protein